MPSPPIALFTTTIASQPALRQRQEYLFRTLQVKKIPFTAYDVASDEDAKRLWRRKAPQNKQQLPGILVGGKFPGPFEEFEDAVEHDELDIFLRLKETWNPLIDEERPMPEVKPIGVPGASSPLQMTPEHLRSKMFPQTSSPSPLRTKGIPVNKRTGELDMGEELSGFGLQGVKVTEGELRDLIAQLGLGDEDAGDLAKGLSDLTTTKESKPAAKIVDEEQPPEPEESDPSQEASMNVGHKPQDTAEPAEAKTEKGTHETVNSEAPQDIKMGL
ncbi:hypothetical protein CPB84DRAFT_1841432 [Gymnopilus junonius]|uniref:SH3 domain-binding glutamic acid-rich protein n=1 Tax=Gymnopilus junonius TaxID=109634 RepID=A0A9P5P309_GYMJU|nr:hypothetical protein CPB84DRAFT_1841432 [Gymnopilus junonius]